MEWATRWTKGVQEKLHPHPISFVKYEAKVPIRPKVTLLSPLLRINSLQKPPTDELQQPCVVQ